MVNQNLMPLGDFGLLFMWNKYEKFNKQTAKYIRFSGPNEPVFRF